MKQGMISFEGYEVQKIEFNKNPKYQHNEDGIRLNFTLKEGHELENDGKKLVLGLGVSLFSKAEENNYPFSLNVEIVGTFESEDKQIENYIPNAVAILFPYLRTAISNITLTANVPPLILPTINVNDYLSQNNEKMEVK